MVSTRKCYNIIFNLRYLLAGKYVFYMLYFVAPEMERIVFLAVVILVLSLAGQVLANSASVATAIQMFSTVVMPRYHLRLLSYLRRAELALQFLIIG